MARMQLVFENPRYISYPYNNLLYISLIVRKWIKKPNTTLVVHGVSFSLDTSDFHMITISCQIFESGKYSITS